MEETMKTAMKTAQVLVEALPYIKKFSGKTVVIKYGGHAMNNDIMKEKVISDIVLMKFVGINPVIVHGGGPAINYWIGKSGKESRFINGLRVTDKDTMEVAQMVLVGQINQEIVALIQKLGGKAMGISGVDGGTIIARKKEMLVDGQPADLGYVGEVAEINTELINQAIDHGFIPVISPIGCDANGQVYNINADYAAGSIAASLHADKLFMLTDINGVQDDNETVISVLDFAKAEEYKNKGIIRGGMIPKVDCCMDAIRGGVNSVHIVNGCMDHSMLLELFTDEGIGTMVVKE
ncbi:MAG: acetylglutamate kinase [Peptococcaceae bacterium]|nr:acetylglutamate kinase [Peptococcaceae bacterium]